MEGGREEFIKSVEELGQYSEEEAFQESQAVKEIAEREGISFDAAEKKVSREKIDGLVDEGKAMEAIRLAIFTWKELDSELIFIIHDRLRELMEAAETEEEYDRLRRQWDSVERWYSGGSLK